MRSLKEKRSGFTLIEMLAVLAVMAVILGVAAPAMLGVVRSFQLTAAGDKLLSTIQYARDQARASGVPVEVRMYQADSTVLSKDGFDGYQVVSMGSVGSVAADSTGDYIESQALTEVFNFQGGVVAMASSNYSPLLSKGTFSDQNGYHRSRTGAKYSAMRFYADGSMRVPVTGGGQEGSEVAMVQIPMNTSYLTLTDEETNGNKVPKNYYCIQVDPFTGKARVYRP
ncbi:MAG: Verru_Chthon cassette protein D [Verrucomicrobiales bacterium]|nr:Verru_Chthon cassette protein D [Verrucomicrobiales bacterium]